MATAAPPTPAARSLYPEAEFEGGRLTHVGGVPVLVVAGSPEQIGRQSARLALEPARRLLDYPLDYLHGRVRVPLLPRLLWRLMQRPCAKLFANIPEAQRRQIEAAASAGFDRTKLVAANTLFDLYRAGLRPLFGCSSWVVLPDQSESGNLLFGRNLDFFPLGYLHDYSLVTVVRPEGKLAFASLGFPGYAGVFSGMNEAGLSLARNEVYTPEIGPTYDPAGVPFGSAIRAVLETCRTAAEATAALGATRHASPSNVVVCDERGGAVVEMAPAGVKVVPLTEQSRACTNHFRHPGWGATSEVNTYRTRDRLQALDSLAGGAGTGVAGVVGALHSANAGELTLQTMVFEPAARAVHVAFGAGPTTRLAPVRVGLAEFFGGA